MAQSVWNYKQNEGRDAVCVCSAGVKSGLSHGCILRLNLLLTVLMILTSQLAWGQANRASITGTVTDSTGAVVPGVEP